jgi:hypothetical protein
MCRIKFVDRNYSLVKKVAELGIEAVHEDYFREARNTKNAVLMTASNPLWSFGGGIDAGFKENFPHLVDIKMDKGGDNERIGNICFTQTVGHDYKATKEIIKKALEFAIENTKKDETLLISGLGCGIGGNKLFGADEFCEVLKEVLTQVKSQNI